ncbi:8-oxo-dGTP pyrophosphatase MutT (NUDIX family) [Chitinophaga skermanii]|uniref:8-oxo-dGTP pyrophosphatase MutT (NUDIX family) n=1 Tax=Chitinophaga skermanii TaxID=331697 RepID=A0A327QF49_9BACT|nr:NUDIX domain-containing protein [Chitinophaga skermanii]RAJ02242.1 8-oxo-dGTP pyrophosphatase MutT (NUDIX family) [Chitinophaga skermanii]
METLFTVYINESPLFIAAPGTTLPQDFSDAKVFNTPNNATIQTVIEQLENNELPAAVLTSNDPVALFEEVKAFYEVLVAAGGLITNAANGEILMMFRRGKWDLPKGKQDEGEDLPTCALREVQEETGLHNVKIEDFLMETFHTYMHKGKRTLKHSYWYKMLFTGTELTVAQIEEDIIDIQWVRKENVSKYIPYSFRNIGAVLTKGLGL